jgi:toxin secretion/phage lysis holin
MKIFNTFSITVGLLGGLISSLLGGLDKILIALITLMILDYATGVCKGIVNKKLSSAVGFKGIIKKVMILIIVAVAVVIEGVIGDVMPIREIVIVFYLCNEAISLLENASEFVPIPVKLKDTLIQLREKNETSSK